MHLSRVVTGAVVAGIAAATAVVSPASAAAATGSLAGAVTDTRGAVVAGAQIYVYEQLGNWDPVAQASTDTAGRFRVPGLKSGNYEIQIGLGGWSEWAPGRIDDRSSAAAYRVVSGRTTKASSTVTAAGRSTGTVTTAAGEPAAGIPLHAFAVETAAGQETVTAADGSYSMTVQPGHSYVLSFSDGNLHQYSPGTVSPPDTRWRPARPSRSTSDCSRSRPRSADPPDRHPSRSPDSLIVCPGRPTPSGAHV